MKGNIVLNPKSFLSLPISSPSVILLRFLKCLSTSAAEEPVPQTPLEQAHQLRISFNLNHGSRHRQSNYELSVVSALKFCSSLIAIAQGQQIHCLVLKNGLASNIFIQNSLITFYSKCGLISKAESIFNSSSVLDFVSCNIMITGFVKSGRLDDARKLFDKMPEKGCVSYTTMIMGFAQNSCWIEAIELFKDMMISGVVPNEVTLSSVISAYSHFGDVHNGQALHALVTKIGLESFVFVSTNLVHMYCGFSCLKDARIIFDEMRERNIVSWNAMLNGYSKAGHIDSAQDLFEKIPARDVVSWATIIDGYVQLGRLSEALRMYRSMLQTGLAPNDVMIVEIISACGQLMSFFEGQQFHSITIKTGFDHYDFIQATIIHFYAACQEISLARLQFEIGRKNHLACWNALIGGLARNKMIVEARNLFNEMPEKDVFSWSSMIAGYSQTDEPDLALEIFHEMVSNGFKPNEITMVSVLSAIATSGTLKEGKWAHEYILNNSIPLNDNLNASIIDMYAKCGSIQIALEIFYQIKETVFTVSPWNAIICGLAMHGRGKLSLDIFSDLQKHENVKLNSITFIGVLTACCHVGFVEEGKKHFQSMKSIYNVVPNIKHYGCMVDLLGRAGRLKEAEELIRSMPMKADVVIWGSLLASSRIYGEAEVGERAAENLAMVEPSHGPSRVLLSNIYADAGRWDDAYFVRQTMHSQGLKRLSGYSGVL